MIGTVFGAVGANRTARRRARNLRAGLSKQARPVRAGAPVLVAASSTIVPTPHGAPAGRWVAGCALLLMLAGAIVIGVHARRLATQAGPAAGSTAQGDAAARVFQPVLPGASFSVPAQPGVTLQPVGSSTLLFVAGMRAAPAVRIDLCSQLLDKTRPQLLPLRIGYRFADVARLAAHNAAGASPLTLRNIVLAGEGAPIPRVTITGAAAPGLAAAGSAPLQLRWEASPTAARWISDASGGRIEQGVQGQVALRQEGWLAWDQAALRIERRASTACPEAGELQVQLYRSAGAPAGRTLVKAFPLDGRAVTAWLAAGQYQVAAAAPVAYEDQALFEQLRARGLLRLAAGGVIELAPRDLAAWQAASPAARAGALPGWDRVRPDADGTRLIEQLYHRADGDYVREQVRIFNSERRLLAWRLRAGARGDWQASIGGSPAPATPAMPAAMARLFARLPEGWEAWNRIGAWPDAGATANARLSLMLAQPAAGGESLQLMLAGQLGSVTGARLRARHGVCSGRACPSPDAVQVLDFELLPGARSVVLEAGPLDTAPLAAPGDQRYRHLHLSGGRLAWQALAAGPAATPSAPAAEVTLADRNGTPLWSAGAPSPAAANAGLAPLLGFRAEHPGSIAAMLARLPSPVGTPHAARLTIDLGLQLASQQALDCIGMRRGRWDGHTCAGGIAPPEGRHAGIVILDTVSGDVLAASGAGSGPVTASNWSEVRAFDRSDPARSPLRLPAFQHDGGANQSPGSSFKIISALGLELAAQRDPMLDALLAGMPLGAINRVARDKGFAFQTDAVAYPFGTRLAHITNYRDQQLDRRAQDGRLGLEQALTYSLNTWFAWSGELSDRSLFGRADGGAPDLQALEAGALDGVRPIAEMARRLGFEQALHLDGGLLPPDFAWSGWDALQASPSHIDPVHSRHELRQMAIGLRMQVTPLQMALAAAAVGEGRIVAPRLLLALDGRAAQTAATPALGVRLDRIRAGMKGVIDKGTAAAAFSGREFDTLRRGLSGKTGTAPTGPQDAAGKGLATVWFSGWLEPGSLPGQTHRLAVAAFVSHSEASGGDHAAPVVAAVLRAMLGQNREQRGK